MHIAQRSGNIACFRTSEENHPYHTNLVQVSFPKCTLCRILQPVNKFEVAMYYRLKQQVFLYLPTLCRGITQCGYRTRGVIAFHFTELAQLFPFGAKLTPVDIAIRSNDFRKGCQNNLKVRHAELLRKRRLAHKVFTLENSQFQEL